METKQENVIRTDYAEIMQKSYIDYAMSVIISRALPDVRDGLKPVQRRTLYDMYELGIRYDRPYRKCARIVGDTMGKYHPHGDSSIYEALVVMAQEFKKGKPLVDGHGNFGSIEGDGAAAMRYTEARLQKLTQDVFLEDLDKNVVDFVPNFDETEKEPVVLPVRIPNLLVNGAEGIAVGMAASIPPHNLGEVVDAMKAYLKDNTISVRGLLRYLKGPDFPTGGIVVNKDDLLDIYETGTGKIRLRGRVEVEKLKGGRKQLVITEIPYTMLGANIGKFLNDVAALVENRITTDIVDISNQSSKEGMRIVLELRRDADVENLKKKKKKKTRLEDSFGVNMLAVADGKPETLSLKKILEYHVDFLFDLTTRKYTTLLQKEQEKKEIQEGLIKACDVIDLIIEILRGSKSRDQAKRCLVEGVTEGIRFRTKTSERKAAALRFTENQATAILEMRLYRLIGLEIQALMDDYEKTRKNIDLYEDILNNYDSMARVILKDLEHIKREFATPRKTSIENAEEAVYEEKKQEPEEVCFLMDRFGYMKLIDRSIYERNKENVQNENRHVFLCMNTDKVALFTDSGKVHFVKISDIPMVRLKDKGVPADNISNYDSTRENILYVCLLSSLQTDKILFVTKQSLIKMVEGKEFVTATRTSVAATKIADGDELVYAGSLSGMNQVVLESIKGIFLKFPVTEVSLLRKNAVGVKGMKLREEDSVSHVYLLDSAQECCITLNEKPFILNKLKLGKRGEKGTKPRG